MRRVTKLILCSTLFATNNVSAVSWNVKACQKNKNYISIGVDVNGFIGDYIKDVSFKVNIDGEITNFSVPKNRTLRKGSLHVGYFRIFKAPSSVKKDTISYTPALSGSLAKCASDCKPPTKRFYTKKPIPACE